MALLAACTPGAPAPAAAPTKPAAPAPAATTAPPTASTAAPPTVAGPTPTGGAAAASAPQAAPTVAVRTIGKTVPPNQSAPVEGTPRPGGTLRVRMVGDLVSLDGHQPSPTSAATIHQVYDRLTEYDSKLVPQPMLAESWDFSTDNTRIQFNLRKGVTFHSGRELTSDDVKYNLLRVRDAKVGGGTWVAPSEWWTTIETPDKSTLIMASDKPRPGVFDFLQAFHILDKDTMEGPNSRSAAIGTGPFVLKEWIQGDHITFTKNRNYWLADRPFLDEFIVNITPDPQSMIAALEAGAADVADAPPARDALRLADDPRYQLLRTVAGGQYFYIGLNTTMPPLDNKLVRQAFNYAIDRQRWTDSIMNGLAGGPQDLPYPPGVGAYEPAKNSIYTYDLDKARSLLARAGVTSFPPLEIMYPTAGPAGFAAEYAAMAQVYQSDLQKIGVQADLKPTEFGSLLQAATALTYKGIMMLGGSNAHYLESSNVYGFGNSFGYSRNFMGFSDPAYGPLVNAAANEPDALKRKALYSQLNDFILDQSFNMPTSLYPSMALMTARVRGVLQRPAVMYVNAWLA